MPGLYIILWLVLLCGAVSSVAQAVDEDTCSTNCTCCINNACMEDIVCKEDCKHGFHGINCTETCPAGCITCPRMFSGNNTCSTCKTGLYGKTCHLNCSRGCQDSKCDKETGVCSHGCAKDYTGDQCCTKGGHCNKCSSPSQCDRCLGNFAGDTCELCKVGFHGDMCNKECINCKGNTCDKVSGKCSEGFYGNFKRKDRVYKGCKRGYWSPQCDKECPSNCAKNKCRRKDGTCYNCKVGWYGKFCKLTCPTNCKKHTCEQNDGTCKKRCRKNFAGGKCKHCVSGRHGENCEKECHNCKDNICAKDSGKCSIGCSGNFTGENCDECINGTYSVTCTEECPRHCKTCSSNSVCLHCKTGYYGIACTKLCSEGCYGRECDKDTGKCSKNCTDQYTGDKCCVKGGFCKVCKSNTLCEECDDDYYGEICKKRCPGKCVDGKCERSDGSCKLKCADSYYGAKCSHKCPQNCKNKICDRINGSCTHGCIHNYYSGDKCCLNSHNGYCKTCSTAHDCAECKDGFYGPYCNKRCSSHCNENVCNIYTGFCVAGCDEGYTGDMCCLKSGHCQSCASASECDGCKSGYYGELCNQTCSLGCRGNKCIKSNGTCESCKKGYHGNNCTNRCPKQCAKNKCHMNGTCYSCTRGFHAPDCSKPCSSTCQNNNCDRNGHCVSCIDGFYGKECKTQCHKNCLTCVSATQCGICEAGFYGEDCRSRCPRNCINCRNGGYCVACKSGYRGNTCNETCSLCKVGTACRQLDGYCEDACKDGYTSRNCRLTCSSYCRTCDRNYHDYCTACNKGKYGTWFSWNNLQISYCRNQCSTNCLHGVCDERTGQCFNCTENWQGDRCSECKEQLANPHKDCTCRTDVCRDEITCSSCSNSSWYPDTQSRSCCPCSNTCRNNTCDEKGECTHGCVDGYYGNGCEWKCSDREEGCEKCSISDYRRYICEKCRSGFYPTKNQCTECSDYCLNGKCDSTNGRCSDGCEEGHWGPMCGNRCRLSCNDGICDRNKGHCKAGCISGHWGETCDETCGRFCFNKTCDRSSAHCVEGCKNGHWGGLCDKGCGPFCLNRTCNRSSGYCVKGCEKGHWGDTCYGTCVNHCEVCVNNSVCVRCEAGRYWKDCSSKCSRGCAMVKGKLVCDIIDGSCTKGCQNERVFGKQCNLDCSENCTGSECEWLTGKCRGGCVPGLYGEFCNNTCADTCLSVEDGFTCYDINGTCIMGCLDGYYGDTCRDECSRNCVNGTCDRDSGSCLLGCLPGHVGANCLKALSATGPDNHLISQVVPIIVALLLVGLLAFVVVTVIWNNRSKRHVKTECHVPRDNDATLHEEPVPLVDLDHAGTNDDEVVYANTAGPSTKIPVAGLLDYVVNMTREECVEIYQTLPKGLIKPYQDSQKPESVPRNRYKTIYPYDFSRVKLGKGNNNYINASFIDGYKRKKVYIASLGPLARTTENFVIFWQMIWEQNVEKIVMLTNLQEPSGMKCEQYWPNVETTVNYDVISVCGRNDDVYADYVIRHLMVTKGDETREVYHLHYIAWPDKTIPDDVISLLDFHYITSSLPTKLGGPTVVHCSAGIGRTGTFIGLDILCKQTEQEDSVDVYACVMTMRESRVGMVQTAEQYMFLHRALAVYVTLGYQPIRSECFSEYVSILDDGRLQRVFANLEACRSLIDVETAAIDRNRQTGTNRACADIPGDKYRVRIRLERQHGASSDYVNAVYMNSLTATNRYIVAQTPGQGGECDFLALLLQERCSAIIDLDPVTSSDDGWMCVSDNKRRSKVNNFHISCSLMTASKKFSQRQLRLSLEGQTTVKELNISLYQFKEWGKDAAVPESPEDFVDFIRGLESAVRKSPENGPILLHCGSAGGRSCLFYVVALAIQRLETEHEVGVVSMVHQVRTRRRGAIPNKEQLLFCYQCVDAYLQSYETYSNFVA